MHQKGGLEPLLKTPIFKYTLNKERIIWIRSLYPYIDTFINSIREIPWNKYTYNGKCEYKEFVDEIQLKTNNVHDPKYTMLECNSKNNPIYFFSGGSVYEILNKK